MKVWGAGPQMKSKYNCAVVARREGPARGTRVLRPAFLSRRTFRPFALVFASLLSTQTVYGRFPSQDAPVTFESLVKSAAAARESADPAMQFAITNKLWSFARNGAKAGGTWERCNTTATNMPKQFAHSKT